MEKENGKIDVADKRGRDKMTEIEKRKEGQKGKKTRDKKRERVTCGQRR